MTRSPATARFADAPALCVAFAIAVGANGAPPPKPSMRARAAGDRGERRGDRRVGAERRPRRAAQGADARRSTTPSRRSRSSASTSSSTASTTTSAARRTTTPSPPSRSGATCAAAGAVDSDPFNINQFGHPYQGSMYHGFARSAGFNYWESAGYTFAGSALWEIAGETTPPSINDQVASGIGGTLPRRGAVSHVEPAPRERRRHAARSGASWRRRRSRRRPASTGSCSATASAPSSPSKDAAYYSRLRIGYSRSVRRTTSGTSTRDFKRNEAQVDFAIDYGLPGKGLRRTRGRSTTSTSRRRRRARTASRTC